ncbi:MAG: sulfotransferase family protein, partial [Planktothrix sp.]
MDQIIKNRIFLVGCPRSGTTLLQSLLAAHPQIASFPESHFFQSLAPAQPW